MSELCKETVGKFFLAKDGTVWMHESYCSLPTATVRKIPRSELELPLKRDGAVGCRNLDELGLRLLVPKDEA